MAAPPQLPALDAPPWPVAPPAAPQALTEVSRHVHEGLVSPDGRRATWADSSRRKSTSSSARPRSVVMRTPLPASSIAQVYTIDATAPLVRPASSQTSSIRVAVVKSALRRATSALHCSRSNATVS